MIHKVERGESSPTATLLGKLSGAFGLSVSALVARSELREARVIPVAEQEVWTDPETGYRRRQVASTPAGDLTEVVMPPGQEVAYPPEAFAVGTRVVWVLEGRLTFVAGEEVRELASGDCLQMGDLVGSVYRNDSDRDVRYLVTVFGSGSGRNVGIS